MNKWFKIVALTASSMAFAQQSFSIDDAWNYAVQHNVNVQKAKIDETIAAQKVKETTGIGLPQINAQAKYQDYIKIPVMYVDFTNTGNLQEFKMAQKYNFNSGVTVSQLLFNGSYLVGLQSAKTYRETAKLISEKTQLSVKEGIMMTYAGVLATDENIKTLEENKRILDKNLSDTRTTYKVGLIEFQNVEQLEYSQKSMATALENLKRTRQKLANALKYQLGYPIDQPIVLTSSFEELVARNNALFSSDAVNFDNHVDMRLQQNMVKTNELLLKLEKSKALPSLAAFYSANWNAVGNSMDAMKWTYPMLWGLQLDVPIFSGLQRHWRTQQAKLNVEKAKLDLDDTRKSLQNNTTAASIDFENAIASFNNAKELIALSTSIYNKQQIKFKEGMGTSFELSQAESQLFDAQRQYYEAALNLIQTRTRLDQATGLLTTGTADPSNIGQSMQNTSVNTQNATQQNIQNTTQKPTQVQPQQPASTTNAPIKNQ